MILNKRIGLFIMSICLLFLMAGCNNPDPVGTIIKTEINWVEMFPVEDLPKVSLIEVTLDGEQIILQEGP